MINPLSTQIPFSINVKGKLLSLSKPIVMGVVNITPDSFFKNSRVHDLEELCSKVQEMWEFGAAIIDIGAASSRPGAKLVSSNDELKVLLPALQSLVKKFPEIPFSIDTYNAETARACVGEGAAVINDISSGSIDSNMFKTIASSRVPYIMMHMQGIPETMQHNPTYSDVLDEMIEFFLSKVTLARELGINDIIIDPGFGFGKSLEHNYFLLRNLKQLNVFQLPILCGLSRKSFINKVIHTNPETALNGTTVLNTIALLNGASILRVHDVLEAKQAIDLINFYQNNN
ncbi:MAG: dihydropteroate synthase [Bacteroidota bacterium]|jgi:dihydropteroate synthase